MNNMNNLEIKVNNQNIEDMFSKALTEKLQKEQNVKKENNSEGKKVIRPYPKDEEYNSKKKKLKISKNRIPSKRVINPLPEVYGVLNGLKFVLTGAFNNLNQNELEILLKSYGGMIREQVTENTSYLIYGFAFKDKKAIKDGKKYKKAEKLNIKKISESQLIQFLQIKLNIPEFNLKKAYSILKEKNKIEVIRPVNNYNNIYNIHPFKINNNFNNNNYDNNVIIENELWTTKYLPTKIEDVIGNQDIINQFLIWLDNWDDVDLNGKIKVNDEMDGPVANKNARACLISGGTGLGKTTIVRLIAKLKGMCTYELNASDQRNENIIYSKLGFLLDNKTIQQGKIKNKNLIIMDEIDSIEMNEDRGGLAALIEIIKKTRTPIVCIANDSNLHKLKSLLNYCYELKFSKPEYKIIASHLEIICKMENLSVESNALDHLVQILGCDIRKCLIFLQNWKRTIKKLKYSNLNKNFNSFGRDILFTMSNYDASSKLLNKNQNSHLNFSEKMNLFSIDSNTIPIIIQENYLKSYKKVYNKNKIKDLFKIIKSTEHISLGDLINRKIKINKNLELFEDNGIHSSIAVGYYSGNLSESLIYPVEIKNREEIIKKELEELKSSFFNLNSFTIRNEIAPLFLSKVSNNLKLNNSDGIKNNIKLMKEYNISMDKLNNNIINLQNNNKIMNKFERISTKIKNELSFSYNQKNKTKENSKVNINEKNDGYVIKPSAIHKKARVTLQIINLKK